MYFRPLTLKDRVIVEDLLWEVNSPSCQMSFPNLWCLREKYGTEFCIQDEIIYIRQSKRGRNTEMAYFPPVGRRAGTDAVKNLFAFAAKEPQIPFMISIPEEYLEWIRPALPSGYRLEQDRDWYEYLYMTHRLSTLNGSDLAHKRRDVRVFWRRYGQVTKVERISRENLNEVVEFQKRWQEKHLGKNEDMNQLEAEHNAILRGLSSFEELGYDGILFRIDGHTAAYSYGNRLGADTFDVIAQKADYHFANLNQALFHALASICGRSFQYINYEEDIGLSGLRQAKLSYKPDILLAKFRAYPSERSDGYGDFACPDARYSSSSSDE